MKIKDTEIKVIKGDITELKVDAIVNAANNKLVMGGGLAGAIKKKGGKIIEEEAVKKGPIEIGGAIYTSAGTLKAKYIIHAATMGMDFQTDEVKIRNSSKNALKVAEQLKVTSLAFPALGCGVGGFAYLAAAKIMSQEVFKHLRENKPPHQLQYSEVQICNWCGGKSYLKEIIFCLYDQEAYEIFQKGVLTYLEYITSKLQNGPFITVDAIIELNDGIVVIQRSNPPFGWALPGGFVDYGESLEEAVIREAKEETGLDITEIRQFHTYSEVQRDPRFHTVATVFIAQAKGRPKAGDDARGIKVIRLNEVENLDFAFDHKKIIQDFLLDKDKKIC